MNLMTGNTTRLTEACKYGSIYLRPHGQAVKTSPFHGGNTGSIPVGVTEKDSQKRVLLCEFINNISSRFA